MLFYTDDSVLSGVNRFLFFFHPPPAGKGCFPLHSFCRILRKTDLQNYEIWMFTLAHDCGPSSIFSTESEIYMLPAEMFSQHPSGFLKPQNFKSGYKSNQLL